MEGKSQEPKMEAEPVLIVDGVRSDTALHEEMLASGEGNAFALQMDLALAAELGFTSQQILKMFGPHHSGAAIDRLEDERDIDVAQKRLASLEAGQSSTISLENVMKKYGVEGEFER